MQGKWTDLQCTNNSKMSTERGRSDGRQQHKPGSDDITANKTWTSTTKGPLFVDLDPHIVLTSVCLSERLFSCMLNLRCDNWHMMLRFYKLAFWYLCFLKSHIERTSTESLLQSFLKKNQKPKNNTSGEFIITNQYIQNGFCHLDCSLVRDYLKKPITWLIKKS